MEENKELETVTESQRNAGKGLFLSGIIVGFAATLLVVGGPQSCRGRLGSN